MTVTLTSVVLVAPSVDVTVTVKVFTPDVVAVAVTALVDVVFNVAPAGAAQA